MDIDLSQFDQIWLNFSGGKDSQTLALQMVDLAGRQGVCGRLRAVHSDTGAEWSCTRSVVQDLCRRLEIPLEIVAPKVAIPEYIEKRQYFPSMRCRFCTSIKTGAIDKLIRKYNSFRQESKVLCVTGERREESPKRSKLAEFEVHQTLTAGKHQVFRYRPLLDWKEHKIWDAIKKSGIPAHPAYTEYGNERLSCALCIFACDQDLRNGAMNRPDLAERYLKVEQESGFLFREKRSLRQVKEIERIIYKEDHSFEKVSKKVEISGKIIGETMLAGIMNLDGWRLAIKDNEHETTLIITGEDEAAITQIKNLLAKTKIDIAILINLNVKQ